MSSTNKTTYYELPQFVDNDIFNPLVDDNDAYSKIDTALHNIADAEADDASEIVSIKSRLDSAEGDIDALEAQNGNSVLTTTAQTLSGAVNELDADISALDGRVDIVEDDINNASTGLKVKVATAENDIDALEAQNGSEVLTTTAQTLSGAVNELDAGEAVLTALTNTLNAKIDNGLNFITNTLINKTGYLDTITGDSDYNGMQGMAYNSNANTFVIAFVKASDESYGMLVEIDATDFVTVIKRQTYTNKLGHANDLTYNPNTNKYYVCTANTSETSQINQLAVINADTLAFEEFVTLSPSPADRDSTLAWEIAYDATKDVYYVLNYTKVQTYSNSFELIEEHEYYARDVYFHLRRDIATHQCIEVFDGKIALALFGMSDGVLKDYCVLAFIDPSTGNHLSSFQIDSLAGEEVEGIFNKSDKLYVNYATANKSYIIREVISQLDNALNNGNNTFRNAPINIPSGADLDDYRQPGKYSILSGAIASTISHNSFNVGGSALFVFTLYGYYLAQVQVAHLFVANDAPLIPCITYRLWHDGSKTWTDWISIGTGARVVAGDIKIANQIVPAFITAGSGEIHFYVPTQKDVSLQPSASLSVKKGFITVRVNGNYIKDIDASDPASVLNIDLTSKTITLGANTGGYRFTVKNGDASAWVLKDGTTVPNNISFNVDIDQLELTYTGR